MHCKQTPSWNALAKPSRGIFINTQYAHRNLCSLLFTENTLPSSHLPPILQSALLHSQIVYITTSCSPIYTNPHSAGESSRTRKQGVPGSILSHRATFLFYFFIPFKSRQKLYCLLWNITRSIACESKQQSFWRDLKGMNKFKKKSYTAGNRTRDPSIASPARFPCAMGVYVNDSEK